MKNSLVVVLIFFSAIVLVKFNYRDTSESRGFDFSMPLQFEKNYLLLRFFVPATTSGIHDKVRKKRALLLKELNVKLQAPHRDKILIARIKDKITRNEKRLNDENDYFIERQGKAAYDRTVKSPLLESANIESNKFTVKPYFIYVNENSRIMRWVIAPEFSTDVFLQGPQGQQLHFTSAASDTPYKELLLENLSSGSWQWEVQARNSDIAEIASGHFTLNKPTSLVFYADTQDSISQHRKAAAYIAKLNREKKIDVVLHGGDITSWGSNESDMVTSASVFSSMGIPGIFVKGNHEFSEAYGYTTDAPYYQKLFSTSLEGAMDYKTYKFGDRKITKLMVWDSNFTRMPADKFINQDRLLRKTLGESREYPVILAGHHGYFSKGWHGSFLGSHFEYWFESLYLKQIRAANVPLTLTGHEHVYQRIVDEQSKVKTQHVVAGTISAKILFPYFDSPGTEKVLERKRTVSRLDFEDDGYHFTTYDLEEEKIIDQLVIEYPVD